MSETTIQENGPEQAFQVGRMVGHHEALGQIATRCTAANAGVLRRLREERLWQCEAASWDDFCETRLKISRRHANRLIRLLEDFGPAYFTIAQTTRISPEDYRKAIAPAVSDNILQFNGEAIAVVEENGARLAAAVAELKKQAAPPPEPPGETAAADLIETLDRHCTDLVDEFALVAGALREEPARRDVLVALFSRTQARLSRLQAQTLPVRK